MFTLSVVTGYLYLASDIGMRASRTSPCPSLIRLRHPARSAELLTNSNKQSMRHAGSRSLTATLSANPLKLMASILWQRKVKSSIPITTALSCCHIRVALLCTFSINRAPRRWTHPAANIKSQMRLFILRSGRVYCDYV